MLIKNRSVDPEIVRSGLFRNKRIRHCTQWNFNQRRRPNFLLHSGLPWPARIRLARDRNQGLTLWQQVLDFLSLT